MNGRLLMLTFVLLLLVAGGVVLDTREIPAPRHAIEKAIGNDHFLK